MKKKVLIVTDYFIPHWTGISKSIFYLIKGIGNEYDCSVLTVRFDKGLEKKEKIEGAKIIREDYLFKFSRSCYSIRLIFKFVEIVRGFDAVIINSPSSNIFPISILAKTFGKKLIIFHQGDLILPNGFGNRIIEIVFDVSSYISFILADIVCTYTLDYAKHSRVIKPFLVKFEPLLLPIYLNPSISKLKSIENLKNKGISIFGFAGRFVEEKGFDVLVEAIKKVVKTKKNIRFIFAGETNISYENFFDKNFDKLKEIEEYFINLGVLEDTALRRFYNSLDFIIVPSRSDCFNLVQAEAMLSGTPSIVSDIPGARFLVKKTGFGVLFKKNDPQDLANKILYLIRNQKVFFDNKEKVQNILNNVANVKKIKNVIG